MLMPPAVSAPWSRNLAAWGIAALENKGTFVSGMLITVVSRSWFVFFLCRNG
jgi:hypothetical protein